MSITPTTNLLATQVPSPVVPSTFFRNYPAVTQQQIPPGNSYSAQPAIYQKPFSAQAMNGWLMDVINAGVWGGGGFGVSTGFGWNTSNGLTVFTNPGTAIGNGWVESQNGLSLVLPDNAISFVWINYQSQLTYWNTPTPPSGALIYQFQVTTSGGVVTAVDNAGAPFLNSGGLWRQTGDRCIPSDTPSVLIKTQTQGGVFQWNGNQHAALGLPQVKLSIASNLALSSLDQGIYAITPTGGNRNVTLPTMPALNSPLLILNAAYSGSNNLLVYDSTGSILIATLTNGQSTGLLYPTIGTSGIPYYPTATLTPRNPS